MHCSSYESFAVDLVGPLDGVAYLFVRGELDLSTAGELEARLQQVADADVIIDLGELGFIDSTGMRVLLDADARARRGGHAVRLTPPSPAVRRAFETVGLDRVLQFVG